jgi:hypothetical protein
MEKIILDIPGRVQQDIWTHLLPWRYVNEESAFMYVRQEVEEKTLIFRYLEWFPVPQEGYLSRSEFHFELKDKTRAAVIKRAHDLNASLVEFHSHDDSVPVPVQFSPTDFLGFSEFVPHVMWRLKGRPYMAIVVSRAGFDGLTWLKSPDIPQAIDGISVEDTVLKPTGCSIERRHEYYGR